MPQGSVHISQALTDTSIRYRNGLFVAEKVYPLKDVDKKSDKYYVYGKENFDVADDRRSPGAEARKVDWSLSSDNYFCEGHALKDSVPRESEADADPALDLMIDTTEMLSERLMLNREADLVAQLDADLTGTSLDDCNAKKFSDDTKDPIKEIKTQGIAIAKRTGRGPNRMVFSASSWNGFVQNAFVLNRISGAQNITASMVKPQEIAQILELDEVIIAKAVKNTAKKGQAGSNDWVWGARALLYFSPPSIGLRSLALGATFRWRKALAAIAGQVPAGMQDTGLFVKTYYWEPTSSDVVEVHEYRDQKTIAAGAGCLFTNTV